MYSYIEKLADAIHNDIIGGLRGLHHNMSISKEQLIQDIIDERLQVIKEYQLKGITPINDIVLAINCIEVDCKDLERCSLCGKDPTCSTPTAHFEIPQLITDFGFSPILYLGTIDRMTQFTWYLSPQAFSYKKYKRRKRENLPYVYIDIAPNQNGMLDCFIFNAPLLKQISIVGAFKDPRQLEQYSCCTENSDDNFTFLNNEIKRRLTEKKIRYYRTLQAPTLPNTQEYTAG